MWAGIKTFLIDNDKLLSSLAAISTLIALVFTGCQIRQAAQAVEASTVYQLQSDGRQLLRSLFHEDVAVRDYLFHNHPGNAALREKAHRAMTEVMQYFSAVVNQRHGGVITDTYWTSINAEMCGTISQPRLREFWIQQVRQGRYSTQFKQWGDACLLHPSTP